QAFFRELITKIDPEVDFRHVDSVYAIAPKDAVAHFSILLWRRWPGLGVTADGHEILNGVVGNGAPETFQLAHYAMTHETGHMMGLADLYGTHCALCPTTND